MNILKKRIIKTLLTFIKKNKLKLDKSLSDDRVKIEDISMLCNDIHQAYVMLHNAVKHNKIEYYSTDDSTYVEINMKLVKVY